ncbi:hypothetical protein mRhiFer1_008568 [Rhinolophus ferrumequinum]|uniref:DDE-1 domain-containing protein n=1 Tax=Rhinolophus ferrumequinum TaxID=59479 RepID=A0A7J7UJJ7_RHIFE|nr:hypothetical protein mRhiFer1_008568 [Rhinolophus ferrumequinum]
MGPKHRKSTANVASEKPQEMINLEVKLKVIEDCEDGKLVVVTAHQLGMSHSNIATILKKRKSNLHPNIKVAFLHPNTTSLIQPVDQGVIAALEAYYLRKTFAQAIAATEEDTDAIPEGLQNIYDCIKNFAWVGGDVTKTCTRMNGIWKKTLKRCIHDFRGFVKDEEAAKINEAVCEMANNLNLGVEEDDIENLLDMVPEEWTNELLELKQEHVAKEEARIKKMQKKKRKNPQEN